LKKKALVHSSHVCGSSFAYAEESYLFLLLFISQSLLFTSYVFSFKPIPLLISVEVLGKKSASLDTSELRTSCWLSMHMLFEEEDKLSQLKLPWKPVCWASL
jgi:hypothetical protein